MLRPWWHIDHTYATINSGHGELRAECCLRECHRRNGDEIIAATLEASALLVIRNANEHVQVATRAAAICAGFRRRRFALPTHANDNAIINARWNRDSDFASRWYATFAATLATFVLHNRATPATFWARRHHAEHATKACLRNLADAIAHRAFLGFRALCCAAACAGLAHIDAFEIHIALRARDAITQRHFDFGFEIESACRTTTAAT